MTIQTKKQEPIEAKKGIKVSSDSLRHPIDIYLNIHPFKKLISKKFIIVIIMMIVSTLALLLDKITGGEFIHLLSSFIPAYLGADIIQNVGISYSNRGRGSDRYTDNNTISDDKSSKESDKHEEEFSVGYTTRPSSKRNSRHHFSRRVLRAVGDDDGDADEDITVRSHTPIDNRY